MHGDDTVAGSRRHVEWFAKRIAEKYEIKTQLIGGASDLNKEGRILNRTLRWTRAGLEQKRMSGMLRWSWLH